MRGKGGIIGTIVTLVIGGAIYTVNQADIVKNFSKDTGLSQEAAQQYVESVTEDDMVPFDELGADFVSEGQDALNIAYDINCVDYYYEWETDTLSCEEGKSQLIRLGNNEIALGKAYTILASDSATREDMSLVISLIDKNNADLSLGIVSYTLDPKSIDELKKANSFNKALLQSALESNQ